MVALGDEISADQSPSDQTPEYPTMLALSAFTTGYLSGSPAIGAQRANVRMAVVSKPSQWSHV